MAKTRTVLVNPGDAGIVYDAAGHSLGGGERIESPELDDVGRAAVDGGRLLLRDEPSAEPPPDEQQHTSRQRNRRARETDSTPESGDDSGASDQS